MKKILFLLLCTVQFYGQTSTGQEQEFDYGIKNNSTQTITTPTYIGTFGTDGTQGKIPSAYIAKTAAVQDSLNKKINLPTGFLQGLQLSINADPTKFNIAHGYYVVTDFTNLANPVVKIITYPGATGLTPAYLATSNSTYIALDKNQNVISSASPFTDAQRRTLAIIGNVVHSNHTTINVVNEIKAPIVAIGNQLHDFMKAIGFLNESGNVYSANGANLQINKSAGTIFGMGINSADYLNPHQLSIPAQTALTFAYRLRGGTQYANTTSINPNNWDNAGVLTSVPVGNRWTIQRINLFQSGLTRIQYGQTVYTSYNDAVTALPTQSFVTEQNIADNAVFRCYLIVQQGTTNLASAVSAGTALFVPVDKFGNVIGNGSVALTYANIIAALGYTPENVANKSNGTLSTSTITYPTSGAAKAYIDLKIPLVSDFKKAYIEPYTTGNIRNTEGDVVKLNSGNYLSIYTKFSPSNSDFSPATIVGRISTDTSGENWGGEILVSTNIGANNVLSVSLIRIDASTLHCFFLVRNSFTDLELNRVVSTDEGLTWGGPTVITSNGYTDILNSSVKRGNSSRILISGESTTDGSVESPTWDIFCYRSDDNGVSYTKSNIVHFATAQGETSVVWKGGNNVMLSSRSTTGFQWFSNSTDNGTTFGTPFQSTLKSVEAPAQIINYSGTLLAIHNPNTIDNRRYPLTISKSIDGGTTWTAIADLNLSRPNYYVYAYPSMTLDGDELLITFHEISGDGGAGFVFSKINIPNLLSGIIPSSPSPVNLYLKGLTFDKSEVLQPEDNVVEAFGKIQSQINKKEGRAFEFTGEGAGIILKNDRADSSMQAQYLSFRNTNGSVVTNFGHLSTSQKVNLYSVKDFQVDVPNSIFNSTLTVNGTSVFNSALTVNALSTFENSGVQGVFKGSDQGAIDLKRGVTQGYRLLSDAISFGIYDLIGNNMKLSILNSTGEATFISTVKASPATTDAQLATLGQVKAVARPYKVYTALLSQSGTSAPTAKVLENTLGGPIVWTRSGIGQYIGTLTGAFTDQKTIIFVNRSNPAATAFDTNMAANVININTVGYTTFSNSAYVDGQTNSASIEIRVYN